MRASRIVVVALALGVVLWGEAVAGAKEQPGVPLAAVEVNSLYGAPEIHCVPDGHGGLNCGLFDPPTPFPRPTPPMPKPTDPTAFVASHEIVSLASEGSMWWTYGAGIGLTWHQCPGPVEERLYREPVELVSLVKAVTETMAGELHEAVMPWRLAFGDEIMAANVARRQMREAPIPIEIVNDLWQARVTAHADEIAASLSVGVQPMAGTCDVGPCNCSVCPKGHRCDCLYWDGNASYACSVLMRDNCDVDETPDPQRRALSPRLDH